MLERYKCYCAIICPNDFSRTEDKKANWRGPISHFRRRFSLGNNTPCILPPYWYEKLPRNSSCICIKKCYIYINSCSRA